MSLATAAPVRRALALPTRPAVRPGRHGPAVRPPRDCGRHQTVLDLLAQIRADEAARRVA